MFKKVRKYFSSWEAIHYILVVSVLVSVIFAINRQQKIKTENIQRQFNSKLKYAINQDVVNSLDDVKKIYRGIVGESSPTTFVSRLEQSLLKFWVDELNAPSLYFVGDNKNIKKYKEKIDAWLGEINRTEPYLNVPVVERKVIEEIDALLEQKEISAVKMKLKELAGHIQARSEEQTKVININKWSVPVSIAGAILTFVFGLMALKNHKSK